MHILLIDALNLIRRLYAVQERPYLPLTDTVSESTRVQIISNTIQMLLQALNRLKQELEPTHALLVFDGRESQWRKQQYPQYKATRKPMPELLADALPQLQQQAEQQGFHCWQQAEYEADDVIATIASKMLQHQQQVTIISTDKGFLPLLAQQINIYDPFSRQHLTTDYVQQKFGVQAKQLVSYWSLVGDNTNNIPGVPGIGPKTAQELIALGEGSLKTALNHPDCNRKLRDKILLHKNDIKTYMQILGLQTQLELGINLRSTRLT